MRPSGCLLPGWARAFRVLGEDRVVVPGQPAEQVVRDARVVGAALPVVAVWGCSLVQTDVKQQPIGRGPSRRTSVPTNAPRTKRHVAEPNARRHRGGAFDRRRRRPGRGGGNRLRLWQPRTAVLSAGQLALLAEHGEERRGEVGDVLFRVGDRRYPLIAIIEGEAAVLDQTGAEINRQARAGSSGVEPALEADRLPLGRGHSADALHRRRA